MRSSSSTVFFRPFAENLSGFTGIITRVGSERDADIERGERRIAVDNHEVIVVSNRSQNIGDEVSQIETFGRDDVDPVSSFQSQKGLDPVLRRCTEWPLGPSRRRWRRGT